MRPILFVALCISMLLSPADIAAKSKPRVVTIEALIDHQDNVLAAKTVINAAILDVSAVFRKEFNIEFRLVAVGQWRPPSNRFDGNEELIQLEMAGHAKSDIVVAFTSQSFFADVPEEIDGEVTTVKRTSGGLAKSGGNHAIVRLYDRADMILIHEIAHLFMAGHSTDSRSVMNGAAITGKTFDADSKEVIRANRDRTF